MEIPFMLLVVLVVLVMFITEVIAVDLVALAIPIVLVLVDRFTGMELLTLDEAVAGFSNHALITVAMMFVLSAGLIRTGSVNFIGERILRASGGKAAHAMILLMVVVAVLSAFINNTPIVVIFLPIVLNMARQCEVSPSRLLIPLSFASIFGGTCTLIGTSTNLVVDGMVQVHNEPKLGIFEFAPLGVVFAVVGVLYLVLCGRWMLPSRTVVTSYTDGDHLTEYVTEVEVGRGSVLKGQILKDTFLGSSDELRVLEVIRDEEILWPPLGEIELMEGDLLLVKGNVNELVSLDGKEGLALIPELTSGELRIHTKETTLAELVVSPNSRLVGQRVRDVKFHQIHGVAVIAVQRRGVHLRRKVSSLVLRFGDTLLVQGDANALQGLRHNQDFILLEGVQESVERRRKAPVALVILIGMILLIAPGILDVAVAAMAGAFLMVVTRCVSLRDAYRSVDLTVLVLIAGTLALGAAMENTGTAQAVVDSLQGVFQPFGAAGAVSGIFFITMVLTSLISNTAAAVLMLPIALSMAETLAVDNNRGFIFAVAFGASACFATPVGYQTNIFVYGPGGYRFSDFIKVGLPLNLVFWVLASFLIPILWPFH